MDKKFQAKRDIFIYIALLIVLAMIPVVVLCMPKDPLWAYVTAVSTIALIVLFVLSCVCRTYYVLKEDHLLIVSGIVKKKVYYINIEKVEPNFSVWSSSALAFDRIKITTGSGFWQREYIAVKDKEEMIAALKERAAEAKKH